MKFQRFLTRQEPVSADFEHLKKQPVIQFLYWGKNRRKVKLGHKSRVSSAFPDAPNNNYKYR